ncbi:polysaccharide export protein [Litchfieldella rifensis]|uniref:Polysaccharide export protein n=1 Tax=Litchfieldella rifensis TaxID=762643 RepID=A0ABV7LNL9_9GAMM
MTLRLRRRWLPVAILAASTLTGCALAPGSHIDYKTDSAPIDDLVDIEPITPGLVASYREMLEKDDAATGMPPELRQQIDAYEYLVGPGDVLTITVYDHPELTIPAGGERSAEEAGNRVRSDGSIFYPYIGKVDVAGKTLEEIRHDLTQRLTSVIAKPQVDVDVAAFYSKKVYVNGAVAEPGSLPITNVPMTIADAISQAGGAEEHANWNDVILTRDGVETSVSLYALMREGDQSQNRLLQDGDVLHVPTAEDRIVSVMGQVLSPGNITLGNEPVSLTDALGRAGGLLEESAEPSGIFVIRGQSPDSGKLATVYQLDIRNAAALTLGNDFLLQPQDVVYVTTAPLARWNRVISLLLPSARLPGYATDAANDLNGR